MIFKKVGLQCVIWCESSVGSFGLLETCW